MFYVGKLFSYIAAMPESRPPIELQGLSLAELQALIDQRRLPPVDRWNPERCGHSGMRIARDGTWYHDGEPIRRPAMVRLFSTVLRRERKAGRNHRDHRADDIAGDGAIGL